MQRRIYNSTAMYAAVPKVTVELTFESEAEEANLLRALAVVDEMTGPSEEVAALTRDELADLIRNGPVDSVEDMIQWDIARREWICREGEWVALYKNEDRGLEWIRQRQKSQDLDWVQRARKAKRQGD